VPTYCHSCPYNKKFCKGIYVDNPTCPHGYSPLRRNGDAGQSTPGAFTSTPSRSGRVLEPNILIKIGKAAANRDDYETAKECYEKILEIEPNNNEVAFLLKRLKYILEDEEEKSVEVDEPGSSEPESEKKYTGMLPHQVEKRISIKPKQQYELDPNIIDKDQEKVYHVEDDEDEKVMEQVSRDVAREVRKANTRRKRNMGLAAGVVVILMMIILLWWFGYLKL
jgi:tetratricopeptide (TPR) repeat protein